ncbi:nicotinamide-nucleotide amidohydrolase family protein [Kingella negevensis]|uniref:CinA family protein n=1 Tax=Kingella negevensis TaxID=1522312 RepID=UPI00254DC6DA|nr:nicotinamide-nucleotide amidohydrolase family protein [Kingella negevensis]MDK4707055.1 nicotinamide-nucleotide amidohydrolase family protein [Kingella negevensis]MDK4710635.1 nicotinamide-nucleotide amidohydrolase family protein [Kingella negevensis]
MNRIEYIASELTARKQIITCAESCTGGLLAAALTSVPGSSAFFQRGYVTYSDQAKCQLVNVNADTLRHYGAVSEEVVREMALGALIASKNDYALSISGIAGPDGGTPEKPVGTVWFGFATKQRIWAKQYQFSGSREEIRQQAVQYSLAILEHYLKTTAA